MSNKCVGVGVCRSRQFELMMVDEDEDWSDMEEVLDEHGSRLGRHDYLCLLFCTMEETVVSYF